MPIALSTGLSMGVPPIPLMAAAAFAAPFASMPPVATEPNAIVSESGYLTIPGMLRVGGWLTIAAIIVITLAAVSWVPVAWALRASVSTIGYSSSQSE